MPVRAAGAGFTVKLEGLDELRRDMAQIAANGTSNLGPIHEDVAHDVRNFQIDHFDTRQGSGGEPWAPLSALTVALRRGGLTKLDTRGKVVDRYKSTNSKAYQRAAAGGAPSSLMDSGRLRGSIHVLSSNRNGWSVGTRLIYAAIHNFGGVIKPKRGNRLYIPVGKGGVRARTAKTARRVGKGGKGQVIAIKSATIPQREFIYLNERELTYVVNKYSDKVAMTGTTHIRWNR